MSRDKPKEPKRREPTVRADVLEMRFSRAATRGFRASSSSMVLGVSTGRNRAARADHIALVSSASEGAVTVGGGGFK